VEAVEEVELELVRELPVQEAQVSSFFASIPTPIRAC
jgi:hypothetical protein